MHARKCKLCRLYPESYREPLRNFKQNTSLIRFVVRNNRSSCGLEEDMSQTSDTESSNQAQQ